MTQYSNYNSVAIITLVRYFFNRDLESDAANLANPASNFSRTAASTMVSDLVL